MIYVYVMWKWETICVCIWTMDIYVYYVLWYIVYVLSYVLRMYDPYFMNRYVWFIKKIPTSILKEYNYLEKLYIYSSVYQKW